MKPSNSYGIILSFSRVRTFFRRAKEDNVGAFAAQAAFFSLLALVPFVILLFSALSLFPFAGEGAEALDSVLPSLLTDFLKTALNSATALTPSGSIAFVSIITALWSSSRAVFSLICGLNSVCRVNENRGYLKLRFCAAVYTLIFLLMLVFSVLLILLGAGADGILLALFPEAEWLFVLINLRFVISAVLLTCFFLLIFTFLPSKNERLRTRLPGAVLTAAAWIIFSEIFSFYASEIADYSRLYGSLATVALIMLWLYFAMYLLLLGAEVNEFREQNVRTVSRPSLGT